VEHLGDPGTVILDTRSDRKAWLASHLRGSLHVPPPKFSDFAGSWLRPEEKIILLVEHANSAEEFARQLMRMGFDHVIGVAVADDLSAVAEALTSMRSVSFADLASLLSDGPGTRVLDVRLATEHAAGHIRCAQNIAHTRLRERLDEVPADRPVVVHCGTGVRAVGAASLLARAGRAVVCVNDAFTNCPASLRQDASPDGRL
jgi:hydroxyacylglutathione hydrolase